MAELLGNGPPHFNVLLLIINSIMANLKSKKSTRSDHKGLSANGRGRAELRTPEEIKKFALIMLSHIQDLHSQSILLSCYNALRTHLIVLIDELISYKTSATRQSKHLRYNK